MRGRSRFRPNRYRSERMRSLTLEVERLQAERRRLEALLGCALRLAVGNPELHEADLDEMGLLRTLNDVLGSNPARGAHMEKQWANP